MIKLIAVSLTILSLILSITCTAMRTEMRLDQIVEVADSVNTFLLQLTPSQIIDSSLSITLSRSSATMLDVAHIFVGINAVPVHSTDADAFSLCPSLNILGLSVNECVLTLPVYLFSEFEDDSNIQIFIDVVSIVTLNMPLLANKGFSMEVNALDVVFDSEVNLITNLAIGEGSNLYAVVKIPAGMTLTSVTLVKTSGCLVGATGFKAALKVRQLADSANFLESNDELDVPILPSKTVTSLFIPKEKQLSMKPDINTETHAYIGVYIDPKFSAIVNLAVGLAPAFSS